MFVAVAVIGIPHRLRADRAGGAVSRKGDPRWFWWLMAPLAPVVALICVGFIVQPRWVDLGRMSLPSEWRLVGVPVGAGGVALFAWMFRHLGLNVTSTSIPRRNATLITSGPYRWIRHPMYSASAILVASTTLLTANAIVASGGTLIFALLAARSRAEEQRLVEQFGEAYRAYQNKTGRFLPRLNRSE